MFNLSGIDKEVQFAFCFITRPPAPCFWLPFLGACVKGPAGCVFADASSSPCVWPVFKDGMEVIRPACMGLGSRGGSAISESNFKFRFPQIILLVFIPLKSAPDEITSKWLEF